MIDVFYYYYYLFYKKILKDNEPHLLATLVLAFSFSLLIIGIVNVSIAYFFRIALEHYIMFIINLIMIFILYLFLHKSGKAKNIEKEEPMFFNNHKLSMFLVFLFFIATSSYLFWGSICIKNILS